jgi:hypothetical protein
MRSPRSSGLLGRVAHPLLLLASAALLSTLPRAVAEPVTFFVSPDTHFTSSGGAPDVEKNARGIHDMNLLPGTYYPAASQVRKTPS